MSSSLYCIDVVIVFSCGVGRTNENECQSVLEGMMHDSYRWSGHLIERLEARQDNKKESERREERKSESGG